MVSVLRKDDTGNDSPEKRIQERRARATCNRLEIYFAKGMASRDRESFEFTSSLISYRALAKPLILSFSLSRFLSRSCFLNQKAFTWRAALSESLRDSIPRTRRGNYSRYASAAEIRHFIEIECPGIAECLFKHRYFAVN